MSCRLQQCAHFFPPYRSIISQGLGNFHALLNTHEDAVVASVSATREILSQMSGAGELSGELQAGINNLDAIFKTHLAEYNILLMPIVTEFKQASMKFSEAVAPKVADLRAEFRSNLPETLNAMGHVMRTVLKMVKNFRDAANEYVEEYRRGAEEYYRAVERMTPEQRELKKAEMEQIGQEIVAKFQKLFDVARGVAESR